MKIGTIMKCLIPLKPGYAKVIDMLPAKQIPPKDKIDLYYSFRIGESSYGAYKATNLDRWILERPDGSYIVLPDNPYNMRLVEEI